MKRAHSFVLICGLALAPACTSPSRAPSRATEAPKPSATAVAMASPSSSEAPPAAPDATPTPSAAAPAPEAPPYDLEADRAARITTAKAELGAHISTAIVGDVFVLVGPPGFQGASFARSASLVRSSTEAYLNGRFDARPAQAITVYLFGDDARYQAFCKKKYSGPCISKYGFYQPSTRDMVMNAGLGLGTLTHELVHPFVETDFPDAPTWINEGIASVFEAPVLPRKGEIHGAKNWRLPRLLQAMRSAEKPKARLDRLFGMSDTTFRGDDEDLHYALARYVCQWLDERGKLWPFYRKWRDTVRDDPTGERAFAEVAEMTPTAAHALFAKWVVRL
ncbi:MAG: hypothetical protein KC657_20825 [Myxococcales bacterium]|nr:hypothetical protein [Myxococcales bacterium]